MEGIIANYNDDFNIAGNKFLKEITEKIKKLDILKLEDKATIFTGLDVKKDGYKIELCMNDYARSLEKLNIRN